MINFALAVCLLNLSFIASRTVYAGENLVEIQKQIEDKKYKSAEADLNEFLVKNPEDLPAMKLLALSYFKQKKFDDAKAIFDRLDDSKIDDDIAYPWGYTYLKKKDWQKAITGFKKVRKNNPLRAHAAYFLGFCYFKLKRWHIAEKFIDKADDKKLAKRLRPKKKKLKILLRKLRDRELEQIVLGGKESTVNSDKLIDVEALLLPQFQSVDDEKEQEDRNILVQTIVELNQLSRSLENHGFVNENLNVAASKTSLNFAGLIPFTQDRISNFGIKASLGYETLSTEFTEATFVTLEQTTGTFVQQTEERYSEAYLKAFLEPFVTLGLSRTQKIQVSAPTLSYSPQIGDFKTWGGRFGKLSYELNPSNYSLALSLKSGEQFDSFVDKRTPEQVATAGGSFDFGIVRLNLLAKATERKGEGYISPSPYRTLLSSEYLDQMNGFTSQQFYHLGLETNFGDFDLKTDFITISRTPPEEKIIVRQNSTDLIETYAEGVDEISLTLQYAIFTGSNIKTRVIFQSIKSYVEAIENEEGITTYQSDAKQTGFSVGGNFAPFEWLQLQGEIGYLATKFIPINFVIQEEFKKSAPDYVNFSAFRLVVGYDF